MLAMLAVAAMLDDDATARRGVTDTHLDMRPRRSRDVDLDVDARARRGVLDGDARVGSARTAGLPPRVPTPAARVMTPEVDMAAVAAAGVDGLHADRGGLHVDSAGERRDVDPTGRVPAHHDGGGAADDMHLHPWWGRAHVHPRSVGDGGLELALDRRDL